MLIYKILNQITTIINFFVCKVMFNNIIKFSKTHSRTIILMSNQGRD